MLKRIDRVDLWVLVVIGIVVTVGPSLLYPLVLMKAMSFAILAIAFNLAAGYGGMFSFGHAAFFGTGAYVTALALKNGGYPVEVAMLLAIVSSALLGYVFVRIAIRHLGLYFAMITLALSQIAYFFVYQSSYANREDGIHSIPRGRLLNFVNLDDPVNLYVFVLVIFLGSLALSYRVVSSPFGRVVEAIRENETRSISLGYNSNSFKSLIFTISAALSGLAGSVYCIIMQFVSLSSISWTLSGDAILMTLIGGIGTPFGPVLGAFLIVGLDQYISSLGSLVLVVRGFFFIVCVLAFRAGIVGAIRIAREHVRG